MRRLPAAALSQNFHTQNGFTLTEVMVTIAVISAIIVIISEVAVFGYTASNKIEALLTMKQLENELQVLMASTKNCETTWGTKSWPAGSGGGSFTVTLRKPDGSPFFAYGPNGTNKYGKLTIKDVKYESMVPDVPGGAKNITEQFGNLRITGSYNTFSGSLTTDIWIPVSLTVNVDTIVACRASGAMPNNGQVLPACVSGEFMTFDGDTFQWDCRKLCIDGQYSSYDALSKKWICL